MNNIQQLICERIRVEFELNECKTDSNEYDQNIWVMAAAAIKFRESQETADILPYAIPGSDQYRGEEDDDIRRAYMEAGMPTHIVRVALRTRSEQGISEYVDGTDIFMIVDEQKQTADYVWEKTWIEGPPIFHGGTVPDALAWVRELAEPFYLQLKDPFLSPEQRVALNGHDEDYKLPGDQKGSTSPKDINVDDIDKWI